MEEVSAKFHWRAVYKNGPIVEQLENSEEILYDNIDKENLVEFYLIGNTISIGVNLETGSIKINGSEVGFNGFSNLETSYRLIYYIESKEVLGSKQRGRKTYCLGLQTTQDKKGLKLKMNVTNKGIYIEVPEVM